MNRRLTIFAAVFVLVLGALGGAGWFVLLPELERRQAEKVLAFLEGLPGEIKAEAVEVDFFSKRITITGLGGVTSYIDGSDLDFEVAELSFQGLNLEAGDSRGVIPLAAGLKATGLRFASFSNMEGIDQPMRQEVDMAELVVRDIKGDYGRLQETLRFAKARQELLQAAATFSLGAVEVTDYLNVVDSPLGSVQASADAFSIQDAHLLGIGGGVWEGIRLIALGTDILALDRLSIERVVIPDFYTRLLTAESGDDEAAAREMLAALERAVIAFKNMKLVNLSFWPLTEEALTADTVTLDLDAAAGRVSFSGAVDGLIVPPAVYRSAGMQAAHFAGIYAKDLDLRAMIDLEITRQGNGGEIVLRQGRLEEAALGSARAEGALLFEGEDGTSLMDSEPSFLLKRGSASLEDRRLAELYFESEFALLQSYAPGAARGADELRAQAAALLRREAASTQGQDYALLLQGFAQLMEAPGLLNITLAPERPVRLGSPSKARLNATAEYTPAQR